MRSVLQQNCRQRHRLRQPERRHRKELLSICHNQKRKGVLIGWHFVLNVLVGGFGLWRRPPFYQCIRRSARSWAFLDPACQHKTQNCKPNKATFNVKVVAFSVRKSGGGRRDSHANRWKTNPNVRRPRQDEATALVKMLWHMMHLCEQSKTTCNVALSLQGS